MSESRQTRRKTEQDAEHKRIGDLAMMLILHWIASKRIQGLIVELTEGKRCVLPKPEWDSYHYCVMCGAHGRFRLAQHTLRKHPDLSHRSDEFKEQPGPTCPPTWSASLIPRCRQYRVPDDPDYIGGAKVDRQFTSLPCRESMFAHQWDDFKDGLGRIVTMDDAIFSSGILLSFFETIQKAKVPVTTRKGFTKALSTWYHFLLLVRNTGMGQQRLAEVEQARYRVKDILDRMKGEEKIQVTFRGVLPRRQRKAEMLCSVVRMIVTHNRVLNAMREIYSVCTDTHNLERREYNHFMGALMAYIVHCNTAGNECIYKMMHGSIYPPSDREPSETGKSITRRDGVMVDYWVGVYGKGKTAERIRKESTYRGNFFVIDEVSRLLVEMYTRMREWVAERNEIRLASIEQPDSPFFLRYATEGHKPLTQLLNYNDSCISACAIAYSRLMKYADREARKNTDIIERIAIFGLKEELARDQEEAEIGEDLETPESVAAATAAAATDDGETTSLSSAEGSDYEATAVSARDM
ncbi:hypothetical protein RB195_016949 [Necator americanus]|uniref:Uncharacterized protein n=1 Tax=Necator americanus TaxID=51031 RepID=A0ABR1C6L3_NECAM